GSQEIAPSHDFLHLQMAIVARRCGNLKCERDREDQSRMIDATHAPERRSWIESANGHEHFPMQNLPLGVFSPRGEMPRGGVAIGDEIFDLAAACTAGLFTGNAALAAATASGSALNPLFALGAGPRRALRARLCELLDAAGAERKRVEASR